MKYITKTKYNFTDWAKLLENKVNEKANLANDTLNYKQLHRIAR